MRSIPEIFTDVVDQVRTVARGAECSPFGVGAHGQGDPAIVAVALINPVWSGERRAIRRDRRF